MAIASKRSIKCTEGLCLRRERAVSVRTMAEGSNFERELLRMEVFAVEYYSSIFVWSVKKAEKNTTSPKKKADL